MHVNEHTRLSTYQPVVNEQGPCLPLPPTPTSIATPVHPHSMYLSQAVLETRTKLLSTSTD
jgi:hypothetical protein